MKLRKTLLSSSVTAALLTITCSGVALAADPAQDSAPATGDDGGIAKVTITAQSRTQTLQDVPIVLTVVTNDQITKLAANNLSDLNGYIPGVNVDGVQPTQPGFNIRGIGSGDFGIGTDAPVGVYVDGAYTGKTGGALMNFNDIERVEVLKGPQGTLFGRNSAAGAISVVTKEPTMDYDADGTLRFGNDGERNVNAMLNVPLSDTVALRMTMVDNRSDGWLTDAATSQSLNRTGDWGSRFSLLWKAPDQTKVLLTWEHERLDQNPRPDVGLIPQSLLIPVPPFPANPSTYLNPLNAPAYNSSPDNIEQRMFNGVNLRISHALDWATFSSTTAYRHFTSSNIESNTGTNTVNTFLDTGNIESNSTVQQEFKLAGKNDTVDWLAGTSYFHENGTQTSPIYTNTDTINTLTNNLYQVPVYTTLAQAAGAFGIPVNLFGNNWTESMNNTINAGSYAVYGDAIWHLTSKLNFTTGIRYSHDSKEFSWYNPLRTAPGVDAAYNTLNQAGLFAGLVAFGTPQAQVNQLIGVMTQNLEYNNPLSSGVPFSMSKSWSDVSPRAVLDYKVTPDVMIYGSVTKGYQSGGFNSQLVASTYQPEEVRSYELGMKSALPADHLTFNAAVFEYKFTNLQALSLVPNGSAIPQYQVSSSDQRAVGLDSDLRWKPSRNLQIFASAEYIDQKYGNFTAGDGTVLNDQAVGTPFWAVATGIDYTQRDVLNGSIDYTLMHAYTGASRCNADSVTQGSCNPAAAFETGGSNSRTDARIGWDSANHNWGIGLFVNNMFNQRYVTNIDNTSTSTLGTPAANISAPRMFGVQLHASM